MPRLTREERAREIDAAIRRFNEGTTIHTLDGRPTDENLAAEAGFTARTRRIQIQQYFTEFPDLRQRWKTIVDRYTATQPLRADHNAARAARGETTRRRQAEENLETVLQVAAALRHRAHRAEADLAQSRNVQEAQRRLIDELQDDNRELRRALRHVPAPDLASNDANLRLVLSPD